MESSMLWKCPVQHPTHRVLGFLSETLDKEKYFCLLFRNFEHLGTGSTACSFRESRFYSQFAGPMTKLLWMLGMHVVYRNVAGKVLIHINIFLK